MKILTHLLLAVVISSCAYAKADTDDPSTAMYSLFVTMHVQPEHTETVYQATMDIAKASVNEPGCYRYDVLRDPDNPTTFYIFEVFRDRESHQAHTKTAHFTEWVNTAAHLLDGDMSIVVMATAFPSPAGYKAQKSGLRYWQQ